MPVYTESSVAGLQRNLTTFRAEGGYITFYTEADLAANETRDKMTPVGTHLFIHGISIQETFGEHPPQQAFGSDYENLTAHSVIRSSVSVNGLYAQEGADPAWMAPGHAPLVAYVDFFMPGVLPQAHDEINANHDLQQTIVVRNLRVTSRNISANDAAGVTYQIALSGGRVTRLATNSMDLVSVVQT